MALAVGAGVYSSLYLLDLESAPFTYGLAILFAVPAAGILTYQAIADVDRQLMRRCAKWLWSAVLGCLSLAPLGMLFDHEGWAVFHSWGLGHGSFIVALPILTVMWSILIGKMWRMVYHERAIGQSRR